MDIPYVIAIYCVGLVLMVAEAILPGMIVGLVGAALLVVAIVFAFIDHGPAIGFALLAVAAAVVPAIILWGLKRMALKTTLAASDGVVSFPEGYGHLVGAVGEAVTPLHPGGIANIDGKKYDVVTEGDMIDRGTRIKVVAVEGNRIVVKHC